MKRLTLKRFKRTNKMNFKLSIVIVLLLITSCSSLKTVTLPESKPIPSAFTDSSDTSNSAKINWRNYFQDSVLIGFIDTAITNNFDLLMVNQQIEAAHADLRMKKGSLFPSVSPNATFLRNKFGQYTSDYAGNSSTEILPGMNVPSPLNDYYLGLQTTWELDVRGKLRNMKKAALERYLASVEGKNWALTNLIAEVAGTYYDLLALKNEADILNETIALQQDAFDLIKIQKEAARTNQLAVKQAEGQLLNSKGLLLQTQQQIIETENYFNLLLGRYPVPLSLTKSNFSNTVFPKINSGVPSDLLKNRPDVRQAELNLIAAKADLKAARASFYPAFNITANVGYEAFHTSYLFTSPQSIAYNLIGNLISPLINRSSIEADFRAAKAGQLQAYYAYQKAILNGFVEVRNELASVENLDKVHSLKSDEVATQDESIQVSSDLFKTGRATYLEIILAEQNALQAKLQLIEIRKKQFYSFINIYKALGGGWR